ncbi:MAG: YncE family protein [Brumimicrobium sp.]|nr:YncE family protein [Brumimicrobium sp.]
MQSIKVIFVLIIVILTGCKKEENNDPSTPESFSNGILVLNEGLFQQNNSTLSWIDLSKNEVIHDIFLAKNNRLLGDTGNDLKKYGSKIYVVVNASSTIEVLDSKTLTSIKQISLSLNGQAQEPRKITFWKNKAFVSSFDGFVNIIDTASLNVINRIQVGQNPEGISVAGDQLFVANSGGLNFPNVDSTVFKIDLINEVIVDTFTVGKNPGDVYARTDGSVYVVKRGDYAGDPSELVRIDSNTGQVTSLGFPVSSLSVKNDILVIAYYDYNSGNSNVSNYDMTSQQMISSSTINSNQVSTLYGAYLLPDNRTVALDAMNFTNTGYLRIFGTNGMIESSFEVGLNPNNIIVYE